MNRLTKKDRDEILALAELFELKVLVEPHQPWDTENPIQYLRMKVEGENGQPVEIYPYLNNTFYTDGKIPGVPLIQVEADIFQVDI